VNSDTNTVTAAINTTNNTKALEQGRRTEPANGRAGSGWTHLVANQGGSGTISILNPDTGAWPRP
jgi:hypothetical protein